MSLACGDRLGPYEVLERIGAGGMGEVYRARDSRLERIVAIKVLKTGVDANSERGKRFLQEARAASALNHPHIVSIFDIGDEGGVGYLVMEYLPGQALERIIPAKGLPIAEAAGYAAEIADALAAAHSAGIVHRDIKPANVIVSPDGHVKVLDFGVAKLIERPPSEYSETRTQESSLTSDGTIVGTGAYMSPEQAAGRPVDHRTDIFSLGTALYEMVAGKRPFHGNSQAELLNAIIHAPAPSIMESNAAAPLELEEILAKALAKDPRSRYQHAGDLALDLRRLQSALATGNLPSLRNTAPARTRPRSWIVAAAGIIVLVLLAAAAAWRLREADYFWTNPIADARITRLTDFEGDEIEATISQDGKVVAFLSDRDGPLDAWVTQIGVGNFTNLTKGRFGGLLDEVAFGIGFTGDGTHLWVRGDASRPNITDGVSVIPVLGGAPRRFLEKGFNVAWSPDGSRIAYTTGGRDGDSIFVSEPDGTGARALLLSKPNEHAHYPIWSPDGRYIYFVRGGVRLAQADVWRIPASGGIAEQITQHRAAVRHPALLDDRTVVYIAPAADGSGTSLYGVDVDRRVPHRLSVGVEQYRSVAASGASGGRRRLVASVANPASHVWSVPISGGIAAEKDAIQMALPSVRATGPRTATGYLLYLSSTGGDAAIWKSENGAAVELWKPTDGATASTPSASTDGRQLCFVARKNGRGALYIMGADGTNRRALCQGMDVQDDPSWSPDGQWIAVAGNDGKGEKLVKVRASDGAMATLIAAPAHYPIWSPDGRFILFRRMDKVAIEAVTPDGAAFPLGLPQITFRNAVRHPYRFLPDGKRLVVLQGQYRQEYFELVDIAEGSRRRLTDLKPGYSITSFDVLPDGKQILFDRVKDNADIVLIEPKAGR